MFEDGRTFIPTLRAGPALPFALRCQQKHRIPGRAQQIVCQADTIDMALPAAADPVFRDIPHIDEVGIAFRIRRQGSVNRCIPVIHERGIQRIFVLAFRCIGKSNACAQGSG